MSEATTAEISASRAGAASNRRPVTAMYRPRPYTSTDRPPERIRRPLPTWPRPKMCNPVPDGDTSTNVAGIRSRIWRAQPAIRPDLSMQWSRSTHAIPSPASTKPRPAPTFDDLASPYEVHVREFVEEAARPEAVNGTFRAVRRTHRRRDVISAGSAVRAR